MVYIVRLKPFRIIEKKPNKPPEEALGDSGEGRNLRQNRVVGDLPCSL